MPYSPEHKQNTNQRILDSARRLFNARGFSDVSIDEIMADAGLTRGGFYNHFKAKEDLYAAILYHFAQQQKVNLEELTRGNPQIAKTIVEAYVSEPHLSDTDNHCPLMALPSDVARAGPKVRQAYQSVLEAMIHMFENSLGPGSAPSQRKRSLAMTTICVGAMVLARTIDDESLSEEICAAARDTALRLIEAEGIDGRE